MSKSTRVLSALLALLGAIYLGWYFLTPEDTAARTPLALFLSALTGALIDRAYRDRK